ncbi:MAG: endonuclease domain-containing protein [Caulobacteraceae bacterium]
MSGFDVRRARSMRKAMSSPELAMWFQLRMLRSAGWHFRRQSPEGPYILDFVCRRAKLIVEVDGIHHSTKEQSDHDRARDAFLSERGFRVLRFWATDVEHELEGVMSTIRGALGVDENMPIADAPEPSRHQGLRYRRLVRLGLRRRD